MKKFLFPFIIIASASAPAVAGEIGVSHSIGTSHRAGHGYMTYESIKNISEAEQSTSVAKQIDFFKYDEQQTTGKDHPGQGHGADNNEARPFSGSTSNSGRGFSLSYVGSEGSRNMTSTETINMSGGENYSFSQSNFTRTNSTFSF